MMSVATLTHPLAVPKSSKSVQSLSAKRHEESIWSVPRQTSHQLGTLSLFDTEIIVYHMSECCRHGLCNSCLGGWTLNSLNVKSPSYQHPMLDRIICKRGLHLFLLLYRDDCSRSANNRNLPQSQCTMGKTIFWAGE
jgi:hypothetical protein